MLDMTYTSGRARPDYRVIPPRPRYTVCHVRGYRVILSR